MTDEVDAVVAASCPFFASPTTAAADAFLFWGGDGRDDDVGGG